MLRRLPVINAVPQYKLGIAGMNAQLVMDEEATRSVSIVLTIMTQLDSPMNKVSPHAMRYQSRIPLLTAMSVNCNLRIEKSPTCGLGRCNCCTISRSEITKVR